MDRFEIGVEVTELREVEICGVFLILLLAAASTKRWRSGLRFATMRAALSDADPGTIIKLPSSCNVMLPAAQVILCGNLPARENEGKLNFRNKMVLPDPMLDDNFVRRIKSAWYLYIGNLLRNPTDTAPVGSSKGI